MKDINIKCGWSKSMPRQLQLCTSYYLGTPSSRRESVNPSPYPVVDLLLGGYSNVPQHSQSIDSRFFVDGSSSPWKHNHPPFRKDHIVRACSVRQGSSGVLRASLTHGSGLVEKGRINAIEIGCRYMLRVETMIEPLERDFRFLLFLGIKKGRKAISRRWH